MTTEKIMLIKLTASEGHYLTNGEVYGKEVCLGKDDKASNWKEVTEEEYEEAMKAIEQSETSME